MLHASPDMPISEAMNDALAASRRGSRSRVEWIKDQARFAAWLDKTHPEVINWSDLGRKVVRQYINEELDNRSPNGKRLALQPITQTASHMSREYQVPNVTERLGIGTELVKPPAMVLVADVCAFLSHLKYNNPRLEAAAALQGLAGLQLQEALRLTWDKVDTKNGRIEISGEVKNSYRNRAIPVCSRVCDALIRAEKRLKIKEVSGPVVLTERGLSYARSDYWRQFSRELRRAIRRWNPRIGWTPKDLRNCLPTFAAMKGYESSLWEQYIGHAPAGISSRHYIARLTCASAGEEAELAARMDTLRQAVVDKIEHLTKDNSTEPDFFGMEWM